MIPPSLSTATLIVFLLPLLTCPCPLDLFTCQGKNANTEVTQCSAHKIQCLNSTLKVQFQGDKHWYETRDILFPEKTFKLLDPYFGAELLQQGCDFLYNFTNPILGFYPSNVTRLIPPSTLFNCTANSYDFTSDVFVRQYERSHCSYELYYSRHPERLEHGNGCSSTGQPMVEWGLQFNEGKSGVVDFSLLSVAFTHHRTASHECFGCVMREGKCGAVAAGSSECHCNFHCHFGRRRRNVKLKVIIAVAALVVGFLLALGGVTVWLKRRQGKVPSGTWRNFLSRSPLVDPSSFVKDPESLGDSYFYTPTFTYEELEVATGGFDSSKELGDGGFGVVYKGVLKDGRVVAVKRLHERNYRRVQQFRNEVEILNRIRHPNLVSLYGCTNSDNRELLLVYEYIPNGTLADHLHGSRASERLLTWPIRLTIASETAAALSYLHATEPQIIHRDVKTSNILLDKGFHVKVGDFGLSRAFPSPLTTHVSTAPQGTPGYVDPEYHQCYQLTDKSDVYSFGVVLVELASSKPAVDMDRPRSEINLSNMAMAKIPRGLMHELVDSTLGFDTDPEVRRTIEAVAELAFRCLQPLKDMRPSMDEVRYTLEKLHRGDQRTSPVEREKHARGDTCSLLKPSSGVPPSPDTVVGNWPSRSTFSGGSS